MRKLFMTLCLAMTALLSYSDTIPPGKIPSIDINNLRTANASYDIKRQYKAELQNCEHENDSLRSGISSLQQANTEKDTALAAAGRMDVLNAGRMREYKAQNKALLKKVYWLTGGVILEGVAIYVMVLKR